MMAQAENHDHWSRKKTIWMWFPEVGGNQLKLSEILVYCYRVYQDEYGETPPVLKICRATGLSKEAVTNADHRLIRAALLESDRTVKAPQPGWFQMKRPDSIKAMGGRHWRHHYTHWEMLVRDPKTAQYVLTHLQAAVIGFLWHCRKTNFQPREGWSIAYLSAVLRCKWETARDALQRLAYLEMLEYEIHKAGQLRLDLSEPTDAHLALFQDAVEAKPFRPARCSISVGEAKGNPQPVQVQRATKPTFLEVVKRVERITGYWGEEAETLSHKLIEAADGDLEQVSIDLYQMNGIPLHKRRSLLERRVAEDDGGAVPQ
jgi:hypothetical protein